MKIEIELSQGLYKKLRIAAKNLKMSEDKFILRAIKNMAMGHQQSREDIAASLKRFFEDNPGIDMSWWNDRSWDDYQPKR